MKKIIFPLKPQMKRPEVGDLQQALILLGSQIAEPETANPALRRLHTGRGAPVPEGAAIAGHRHRG